MGQLIKITTKPYEAVRIQQNAKFVSSDQVEAERRRALRQSQVKASQAYSANRANIINRVDQAYSNAERNIRMDQTLQEVTNKEQATSHAMNQKPMSSAKAAHMSQTAQVAKPVASSMNVNDADAAIAQGSVAMEGASEIVEQNTRISEYSAAESNANYYQERGSLEMKIQRGDVSFVPAMEMTIVTQKPEVNIEYTGDFNYFPKMDDSGSNVNLET